MRFWQGGQIVARRAFAAILGPRSVRVKEIEESNEDSHKIFKATKKVKENVNKSHLIVSDDGGKTVLGYKNKA